MKIVIPKHLEGNEKFAFLVENKSVLLMQKKACIKEADPFHFSKPYIGEKGEAVKAAPPEADAAGNVVVNPVINTTFLMDSHDDVHIDGIWKENLKYNKNIFLVQEHKSNQFDKLITNNLKAITKKMSWRDLGADYDGITEALIFSNCTISPKRNPYMYELYKDGLVENHSVGMIYVDMGLAVNNPDYKEEFAAWNKYIDKIANKEEVESQGYFWPIYEAKIVEGSAVPFGSNWITPTLNDNMELITDTKNRPGKTSETQPFDVMKAIQETKFFN